MSKYLNTLSYLSHSLNKTRDKNDTTQKIKASNQFDSSDGSKTGALNLEWQLNAIMVNRRSTAKLKLIYNTINS